MTKTGRYGRRLGRAGSARPRHAGPALLVLLLALAGCAETPGYQPVVDLAGGSAAQYAADLKDCRAAADLDRYGPVVAGALVGAGLGAGLGNLGGWLAGANLAVATGYGAGSGAVLGAAAEAASPRPSDAATIDQCLRNNGWTVKS